MKKITIAAVTVIAFALTYSIFFQKKPATKVTLPASPPPLSNAEKLQFYEEHLKALAEMLHKGELAYPLLRSRYEELWNKVLSLYQKPITIEAMLNHHPDDSKELLGGAWITPAGNPCVSIFVPRAVEVLTKYRNSGRSTWKAEFTNDVIIVYLHEVDHHALGHPLTKGRGINIRSEKEAWAETCRHVIVPMAETYHLPLSPDAQELYESWIRAGKNEESPVWFEAIRKRYE